MNNWSDSKTWRREQIYETSGEIGNLYVKEEGKNGGCEVLATIRYSDMRFTMVKIEIGNREEGKYGVTEVGFDNNGIKEVVGVEDYDGDGEDEYLYITAYNQLAIIKNLNSTYLSILLDPRPLLLPPNLFSLPFLTLNENSPSLLVPTLEGILIYDHSSSGFIQDILYYGSVSNLQVLNNSDILIIEDGVLKLLHKTPILGPVAGDAYTWRDALGDDYTFFLQTFNTTFYTDWTSVKILDTEKFSLLLYSESSRALYLNSHKKRAGNIYEAKEDFYIYLFIYVLAMTIAAGVMHEFYLVYYPEKPDLLSSDVGDSQNIPPAPRYNPSYDSTTA